MMTKKQAWLHAFRLRTLPLALSCIALGSFLAASHHSFRWEVLGLAALTTLFLQILSNLANDYGDSANGVDNDDRVGPERAVQSGVISLKEMLGAVVLFSVLSFVSGVSLVILVGLNVKLTLFFMLLGVLAIWAAIKYTVGQNPYGYAGLGDIFVFLFFGIVGVVGTYFLHTQSINWWIFLPAASFGMLSAGVLNLNNMRDREEDQRVGKMTLAVKLGQQNSKNYHAFLLVGAILLGIIYTIFNFNTWWQFSFLLVLPLIFINLKTVFQNQQPQNLDPLLKKLALTSLLFVLTFGIGLLM